MRFMMIVKSTEDSEKGNLPTNELISSMNKYNDELAKAGVLLDLDGLAPSSQGARVVFKGDKRSVVDGPFAETKELIAGFWIIQAKSLDEAVEWAKRAPNPHPGAEGTHIEVRRIFELEDLGDIPAVEEARALGERLAKK